jgi:RNA polymerase sigma-70 factor (family 1)
MNPYEHHTDSDLVQLLIAGDRIAFEIIYHRYAAQLYRYARARISSSEDCQEMVQDVFESLWIRHESLSIDSLARYLFTSIRYMIIRYFYQRGVRQRYLDHYAIFSEIYDSVSLQPDDPDQLQKELINSLNGLPERCRMAMTLRLKDNLSNGEIASRMNITKKTVEIYMSQAIAHLRTVLRPLYKTP